MVLNYQKRKYGVKRYSIIKAYKSYYFLQSKLKILYVWKFIYILVCKRFWKIGFPYQFIKKAVLDGYGSFQKVTSW